MMIIKGEDLQRERMVLDKTLDVMKHTLIANLNNPDREEQLKTIDMVADKYSKEIHYALLLLAHEKQKNRTFIA